jgi:ankyrin repeat protein
MDINDADNRGSTPMHWACFARSEFALSYLLAMKPDLEYKDKAGNTPLHLAIKSVPILQSTRPVRALLIRGADRATRNDKS